MPPYSIPTPVLFLEPIARARSIFTDSRLAVFSDGTTCTVLIWLAWQKFGVEPDAWPKLNLLPFWKDGNRRNETLENVEVAARTTHRGEVEADLPAVLQDVPKTA